MKDDTSRIVRWIMENNIVWMELLDLCKVPTKKEIDANVISRFISVNKNFEPSYNPTQYDKSRDMDACTHVRFYPSGMGIESVFDMEDVTEDGMKEDMCDMMLHNMLSIDDGKISLKDNGADNVRLLTEGYDNELADAKISGLDEHIDIRTPSIDTSNGMTCGLPDFKPFNEIGLRRSIFLNVSSDRYSPFETLLFIDKGLYMAKESSVPFNPNMVDLSDISGSSTLSGMIGSYIKNNKHKLLVRGHLRYPFGCVDNFGLTGGLSLILSDPSMKLKSFKNFPEKVKELLFIQDLYDVEDMSGLTKDIGNLVIKRVRLNDGMEIPKGVHVRGNVRFIDVDPKFPIMVAKSDMQIDGLIISEYYSGTKEHLLELIEKYGWDDLK